jgi:hypothetical protein
MDDFFLACGSPSRTVAEWSGSSSMPRLVEGNGTRPRLRRLTTSSGAQSRTAASLEHSVAKGVTNGCQAVISAHRFFAADQSCSDAQRVLFLEAARRLLDLTHALSQIAAGESFSTK